MPAELVLGGILTYHKKDAGWGKFEKGEWEVCGVARGEGHRPGF